MEGGTDGDIGKVDTIEVRSHLMALFLVPGGRKAGVFLNEERDFETLLVRTHCFTIY